MPSPIQVKKTQTWRVRSIIKESQITTAIYLKTEKWLWNTVIITRTVMISLDLDRKHPA
jgi:hypothetical protein